MNRILLLAVLLSACVAVAQSDVSPPPPPLVNAPADDSSKTPADAPKQDEAPTPPPPGAHLPGSRGSSGYSYSPYGAPLTPQKEPPREYGLIATEFLFGVLTAAPVVLLPYVLFLRDSIAAVNAGATEGASLVNILFLVIFASVPVAVAQTEIGIARGSRFYEVEEWTAYLSGLVAQAAVLGLYYLVGAGSPAAEPILLGGSILFVPAVVTAALNLTKTPRVGMGGFGFLNHAPGQGWSVGRPTVVPIFARLTEGVRVGVSVPVAAGTF